MATFKDYEWAANKVKLEQSYSALKRAGNEKPSEEEVREEYVKRAGRIIEDAADEAKNFDNLSPKELKALAEKHEVDLEGATKKADIIAKLEEAGVTL